MRWCAGWASCNASIEQPDAPAARSIDALVRRMGELQRVLGLELIEHGTVLYRSGGHIARVPRDEFAKLASTGQVSLDTVVFDNTLARVSDLREGRWEMRAADTWHARAFF